MKLENEKNKRLQICKKSSHNIFDGNIERDKNEIIKNEKSEKNMIIINLKKPKLDKMKMSKGSMDINSYKYKKINNIKHIKKRFNSLGNFLNKENNSSRIETKEKISIENSSKNKTLNSITNKKKNITIINYDKAKNKNKFIQKSNSFLGKKMGGIRNIERRLVPRINHSNYCLNNSFKKLPNKNKCNDKQLKNTDTNNRAKDRTRNIVVKIDLTET